MTDQRARFAQNVAEDINALDVRIEDIEAKVGAGGANGLTPHIGANGNWWLGDEDTGQPARGEQGERGFRGERGEQGERGLPGERGIQGLQGAQGIQGLPGVKGDAGERGAQGERGLQGVPGGQGARGEKGDPGERGLQGIQGERGLQGLQGVAGAKGEKGEKGDPGTVPQSVIDLLYAKSQLYVQSRLGLIANGAAGEGTNYNFSSATLNKTDAAAGFGCFQTDVLNGIVLTDEYIAIDPGSNYQFSFYAKTLVKNGNSQAFAIIDCYDADKLSIKNEHLPFVTFRLAVNAKTGDKSVKVHADDIAAVTTAMSTYGNIALLHIGLAEYKNSFGYTYKQGIYTRNLLNTTAKAGNLHSISADGTLGEFGSGLTKDVPAGTVMTLSRTGGVYLYPLASLNNTPVPEEWTRYSGNIAGSILRGGTAFVRVGWQLNRSSVSGNKTAVSSVSMREV